MQVGDALPDDAVFIVRLHGTGIARSVAFDLKCGSLGRVELRYDSFSEVVTGLTWEDLRQIVSRPDAQTYRPINGHDSLGVTRVTATPFAGCESQWYELDGDRFPASACALAKRLVPKLIFENGGMASICRERQGPVLFE